MVHTVNDLVLDARSQSGEVCAVSGYPDDQLRMVFRMFLCVYHFFFVYNVELNVLSAMGQISLDHASEFFQIRLAL